MVSKKDGRRTPPSVHDTRRLIRELRRIDLESATIDLLKERLSALMTDQKWDTFVLPPGQTIYRGVRWDQKPSLKQHLSYPPVRLATTYQRANRPGEPLFYGSTSSNAPAFEIGLKPGDQIAVAKWRSTAPLLVNNVGYTEAVLRNLASRRSAPEWSPLKSNKLAGHDKLRYEFLSSEFSKIVSSGKEHEYKLSAAIAELLYKPSIALSGRIPDYNGPIRWAGLIYPAIAIKGDGENIALLPEEADSSLKLELVEWSRVTEKHDEDRYDMELLDFADSVGDCGEIEWKGRLPQVTVPPGGSIIFSQEDGRCVARDGNGHIVPAS